MATSHLNEIAKIISLRWEKQYTEALALFKDEIAPLGPETVCAHPRLIVAICDCLKETYKAREAVRFVLHWLRLQVPQLIQMGIATNIGWLFFFYFQQKGQQPNETELLYAKDLLQQLMSLDRQPPAERLFFAWAEAEKGRGEQGWKNILAMLQQLKPSAFSTQTHEISIRLRGKEKEIELASAYEQAVMLLIKAHFALRQYEECVTQSQQALGSDINFHYGNQIWIARYIALSYRQMGRLSEAIHQLEMVAQKRREWFVMKELAELYAMAKNRTMAEQLAHEAVLYGGYSAYKTSLFEWLGSFYEPYDPSKARQWFALAAASRQESGWRLSQKLLPFAGHENKTAAEQYKLLIEKIQLTEATIKYWSSCGSLTRILHEGENGDGFITSDDGKTVYFRFVQCKLPFHELQIGQRLSFKAIEEERKGKKVWKATKVFAEKKKGLNS